MWTEARIKAYLDGTLTRILSDGRVHTISVSPDYIHTHLPSAGRERGIPYPPIKPWTQDEEIILQELRRRRVPRYEIAERLGRSEECIRRRIYGQKAKRHAAE